ncbi:MAG TPA: PLP-dependent aminotransferase family protein [Woeseiaceae bacterium]
MSKPLKANSASTVVTFDGAPKPGFINFGVGQPSADLLSVDLVRAASELFFATAQPLELNYGERQGDVRFLASLSRLLETEYGKPAPRELLMLTAGNSHALDFVCNRFTKPGDTVFVEDPSYFLAFQILRDHGLNIVGIPVDEDGLDIGRLEQELKRHRPTLLYTIPSYHNPTGRTMSRERRERLVALSKIHDFVIAADEVYQMLYYGEPPPPALGTYTGEGNVLSLGSFSKILAPAMRLGWIQTDEDHMRTLVASGTVNSGGSFNQFTSHIVRQAIDEGLLADSMLALRAALRGRVGAMDKALHDHLDDLLEWQCPEGGYFFWLKLRDDVDARRIRDHADDFKTGFQPGNLFSPTGQGLHNFIRLSFAHYNEAEIEEGVARLAALVRQHTGTGARK